MITIKPYPRFKVDSQGSFSVLRTHGVSNTNGVICGGWEQFIVPSETLPSFVRQRSFSKVEATRFAQKVNDKIDEIEDNGIELTDSDVAIIVGETGI